MGEKNIQHSFAARRRDREVVFGKNPKATARLERGSAGESGGYGNVASGEVVGPSEGGELEKQFPALICTHDIDPPTLPAVSNNCFFPRPSLSDRIYTRQWQPQKTSQTKRTMIPTNPQQNKQGKALSHQTKQDPWLSLQQYSRDPWHSISSSHDPGTIPFFSTSFSMACVGESNARGFHTNHDSPTQASAMRSANFQGRPLLPLSHPCRRHRKRRKRGWASWGWRWRWRREVFADPTGSKAMACHGRRSSLPHRWL